MKEDIMWVIQNSIKSSDIIDLTNSLDQNKTKYQLVSVAPFSNEIPKIDFDGNIVFYGGTQLTLELSRTKIWNPGVFFDENLFTYSNYISKYQDLMLNFDCDICSLSNVLGSDLWKRTDELFIRPDKDLKEFGGCVMTKYQIEGWVKNLYNNHLHEYLTTKVILAPIKEFDHEYRLFIVNGKISSGSKYRSYGKLSYGSIPPHIEYFVKHAIAGYSPNDVFVIDVCDTLGGECFILEINCFNNSGFYESDKNKILKDVSDFVLGKDLK